MPKITDDPVQSATIGLRRCDKEFIERVGVGNNLGAKIRSVIDICANMFDNIAGKKGSTLVYSQSAEGERHWNDCPFPIEKKKGWQAIGESARIAGYVAQVKQNESLGEIEVWVALGRRLNNCAACRARVQEAMK